MNKNFKVNLMRCWAINIPSIFFSIVTDTLHLISITAIASIMIFMRKSAIQLSLRSGIYSTVMALTVIVLTNSIITIENRFFMSPAELAVPTSLIFAITLSFFDERPTFTATVLIMCIFSLMMCGDINTPHTFQNLPFPDSMGKLHNIHILYLVCLSLSIVPLFFLMNRSHFQIKSVLNSNKKLKAFKVCLIIFSLVCVVLLYSPTQRVIVPFSKTMEAKMAKVLVTV